MEYVDEAFRCRVSFVGWLLLVLIEVTIRTAFRGGFIFSLFLHIGRAQV